MAEKKQFIPATRRCKSACSSFFCQRRRIKSDESKFRTLVSDDFFSARPDFLRINELNGKKLEEARNENLENVAKLKS